MIELRLASASGELEWCRHTWNEHHYLHSAIDPRCRPIAYIVLANGELRGALGFGRPESTRCNGWYGSVDDVRAGRAALRKNGDASSEEIDAATNALKAAIAEAEVHQQHAAAQAQPQADSQQPA